VQDGAEWLQGLVDVLRSDAVRILDFPHAVEHLTAAAQPSLGIGTATFAAWLDQQAHTLKHAADGARQILTALARLPVHAAADPILAAEARDRALAYFTKRLVQVQYAAFQAAGYPIGSGSTESANKVVVETRLKGSGMHWARENVNPLVALRTVACTDRWAEVWPCISARLRTQAEERRRARWRARHPAPDAALNEPPTPPAIVAIAQPPAAEATLVPRGKSVVNGRPTAFHPWKRYDCLPGGRRAHGSSS
jgi:hypothetical protein